MSKVKKCKLLNLNDSNDSLSESDYSNDCLSESGFENNNDNDELNKSLKRLLSVDSEEQQAIKRLFCFNKIDLYICFGLYLD